MKYLLSIILLLATSKIIFVIKQPIEECIEWWQSAGGFDISYPKYDWYKNKDLLRNHSEHLPYLTTYPCEKSLVER